MRFLQRHCCHLCERGPPCPAPAVQRAAEADHADEQRQHARQRRARAHEAEGVRVPLRLGAEQDNFLRY